MENFKQRIINILIGFDQFMQVLVYLGKYTPDETISGMIGRHIRDNSANKVEKMICYFLRKIEHKHCINSIDNQERLKGE